MSAPHTRVDRFRNDLDNKIAVEKMFTLGVSGLITAYVLVAVLLLGVNLYSSWSWPVKAGLIIIVSAFYVISYFSFPPLLGWPTKSALPENFRLVAVYVNEPDKVSGEEGEIYIWATEITTSTSKPRAYRLPFSPELHTKVVTASKKLAEGMQQVGEVVSGEKKSGKQPDQRRNGRPSADIEFYDLPAPLFPEK